MLEEAFSDIACSDADDSIVGGVIGRRPAKECYADTALTKIGCIPAESLLHNVFQKILAAVAPFKRSALYDFFEMRQKFGFMLGGFSDPGDSRCMGIAVNLTCHSRPRSHREYHTESRR
jgi:hypothetical protein